VGGVRGVVSRVGVRGAFSRLTLLRRERLVAGAERVHERSPS
jgi:hypothetical protein